MDQIYVFLYGNNNSEVVFRYFIAFLLLILCVVTVHSKKWRNVVFSIPLAVCFSYGWQHFRAEATSTQINNFLNSQQEDVRGEIAKSITNRGYSHDFPGWFNDDNDVGVIRNVHLIDMKIKAVKILDKMNNKRVLEQQKDLS